MEINTILLFLFSSISLTLLPGPDIFFVVTISLTRGWEESLKLIFGICSGLIIQTLLIVLGLGSFFENYPGAIRFFEYMGAGYLLYLSYKLLIKENKNSISTSNEQIYKNLFFTGLIMNLSNPKVMLFFISFFPGFLFSSLLSYKIQLLILGAIFIIQAFIMFIITSFTIGSLEKRIKVYKNTQLFNKIQAIVLFLISIVLILP